MTATGVRGSFEQRGHPAMLDGAPDPALLKAAGAPKTSAALKKALALRNSLRQAQRTVQEAKAGVLSARKQDLAEHAEVVARDPSAKLSATRSEEAENAQQETEQRVAALIEAVERQSDVLLELGSGEAQQLAEAAQATRARAVERVPHRAR
jgi:gas vesicle protein